MDLTLTNGNKVILHYEQFKVASAKDKYKLTVGGFQGPLLIQWHTATKCTSPLKTATVINGIEIVQYINMAQPAMCVEDGGIIYVIELIPTLIILMNRGFISATSGMPSRSLR